MQNDPQSNPITADLRSLPLKELTQELTEAGFPAFRAGQVYRWLHVQLVQDIDEMSNLPKNLRAYLQEHYRLAGLRTAEHQVSRIDGTQKFLFELPDGETVESVYMRYHYGSSVCVSSQAGCRMGCRFCASTIGGLARNLLPGEMLEEVYAIQRSLRGTSDPAAPAKGRTGDRDRVSHVVVMGTGEPLDNYDNVVRFLRMLTDADGLHLSARNITLSTCGIVPRIYDLAGEELPVTLALSLHAVTDEKRREIMPIANRYRISECMEACRFYAQTTGRRVTFEYSLIRGVNDTDKDAEGLAALAGRIGTGTAPAAHINLIPVNPVTESGFERPDSSAVRAFQAKLEKRGINVSIRRALGRDIDGACGQLRHRHAGNGE